MSEEMLFIVIPAHEWDEIMDTLDMDLNSKFIDQNIKDRLQKAMGYISTYYDGTWNTPASKRPPMEVSDIEVAFFKVISRKIEDILDGMPLPEWMLERHKEKEQERFVQFDTCHTCGGQMTPDWEGYGEDGAENGNCADEEDGCEVNAVFDSMYAIKDEEGNVVEHIPMAHDWDREEAVKWIHEMKQKYYDKHGDLHIQDIIDFELVRSNEYKGEVEQRMLASTIDNDDRKWMAHWDWLDDTESTALVGRKFIEEHLNVEALHSHYLATLKLDVGQTCCYEDQGGRSTWTRVV